MDGMARPLRIEYEGAFYHVTSRGNERKRIFFGKADYDKFKEYLQEAQDKFGYRLHCYVLMGNHYHLLIETPNGNMSRVAHFINSSYTNYINRKRNRSGHLLQGRYKGILVDRDSYLLELSRYVHLNPVRANLVEKPEDYRYSSYHSYVYSNKDPMVFTDLIMGMISRDGKNAQQEYRAFAERGMTEGLNYPLAGVYGGVILGSKGFIKEALTRLQDSVFEQKEIARGGQLNRRWECEEILGAVRSHFQTPSELAGRKESRDATIYLLKKYASATNEQIGELFGRMSYSAVAKAHRRFADRMTSNRSLRKAIAAVTSEMSNVKV
jgi:putative transposase